MKRLLCIFLLCTGCSSAGPFVTDIQFPDKDTVQVQKCTVEHNYLTGKIETGPCTTENISRQK